MPPVLHPHLAQSTIFARVDPSLLEALENDLELVRLDEGDVLVRQGEEGDAMYVLLDGDLEVSVASEAGSDLSVDRLGPGASVGEMALVAGGRRSATVRARRPSDLVRLPAAAFRRLATVRPELHEAVVREMEPRLQRVQLGPVLTRWFGDLGREETHALQEALTWVHLAAGEVLFREGDPADGMFLVVGGRVRTTRRSTGGETIVGDVTRGGSVGAYAAVADGPRRETVLALRDSQLVRLDREVVARHPPLIAQIARTALERAPSATEGGDASRNGRRTFAVLPADADAPARTVARRLAAELGRWGRALHVDAASIDRTFGREGASQAASGAAAEAPLAHWLNEREREHDHLVLEAEAAPTPWTRRCLRQADVTIVVADAGSSPVASEAERMARRATDDVELVLVHPGDVTRPHGTARWLEARSVDRVHHLRLGHDRDAGRLARRLTGRAVGLVFSGGGARGYAHIGLVRAVEELGLAVDAIGGTSMGALVGGAYALSGEYRFCYDAAARFGDRRKLVDRTLPMVALTRSKGVTDLLRSMFGAASIEDLFVPFFCVSSNLTRAEPVVHRHGPMWEAIRASTAIPGVFTPLVHEGDVLVDGGVMNGFPVDLMRAAVGTGVVIGSNASSESVAVGAGPRYAFGPEISGWRVLLERALPARKRPRYPSMLGTLMRATSLSSKHLSASARSQADLVVEYPTHAFGSLDFDRYDELVEIGHDTGRAALQSWLASTGEFRRLAPTS